jgi:outer membrane receptor protein involved in Fe transport
MARYGTYRGQSFRDTAIAVALLVIAPYPGAASAQQASDDDAVVEEIIVTGSRIVRRDFASPSPIMTIDRDDIESSAHATLEETLNRMPQVVPDFGRTSNNPGDGTARINLRGLGPGRSLVLLNSRRLAPSGMGSAVDLNNIPQVLVERVEVITGGASTVYGSDALAGVVNFITRQDFEGFAVEGSYNVSGEGDADSYDINLALGTDFAGGAGNVVVYGGYFSRSEVFAADRTLTSQPLFEDTDPGGLDTGGSFFTPEGVIGFPEVPWPNEGPTTFLPNGDPREMLFPDDFYNFQPANYLQVPHDRYSTGVFATWEMSSGYEWYLEASFARNEGAKELASVPARGTFRVNSDNPVLTPTTQQLFIDYLESEPGFADIFLGRRMIEVGPRHMETERDYLRAVLGLRGELGHGWHIDGWVTWTESDEAELLFNDTSRSRLQQALLVDPVSGQCFDPSNGCVAIDIFGPDRISPEAASFVRVPTMTNTSKRTQKLASVFVRGEPFDTWAGPVGFAAGLEWRSDEGSFRADAGLFTGDTMGYGGDASVDGTEEVSEVYAEAIIPLLGEGTGRQQLELEIGGRYSKYDNAGSSDTWKLGAMWQPVDSIRLRVMAQRSVRAPNNQELFTEQGIFSGNWVSQNTDDDPCSASSDPVGNGNAERCIIQGLPEDQLGVFEATPFFPVDFVFGGNPELLPEEAETLTIGAVLTPTALPNWNFALDYYQIELDGEIGEIASDEICFDPANSENIFCENVNRGPTGDVVEIVDLLNNRGIVSTKGIDTQVDYVTDLPSGFDLLGGGAQFGFNLVWTHVLEEKRQANVVAQVFECVGYFGSFCGTFMGTAPENRLNTTLSYSTGELRLLLNSYWVEGMDSWRSVDWMFFNGEEPTLAVPSIGSKHYLNLNLSYDFSDNISASLGVANLLDTEAPFLADNTWDGTNTDVMLYDVFGRTFSVSFAMRVGN